MSEPLPAPSGVFLSYAREDSDAARRIADALRAFGVEVWFDQSELRGGDAWDAKIRKQIRECALFVPIISARTQARGEGYFRREWKLAVDRTHDMASGVPFLMPVVIDDTAEADALVPEELMRVQWTRLEHGVPTPQFVDQIKQLIANPRKKTSDVGRSRAPLPDSQATGAPAKSGSSIKTVAWVAAVTILIVAAVGYWIAGVVSSKYGAAANAARQPAKTATATPANAALSAVQANDKSIAVLPFSNMSEEKDSAFFTDGIHEDILTNLALIRDLRVVSRTSVMQYRDTTKSIGQVARELGVTYILEGSVRRAGNKVRVTGQLIHAATDEHVWAKAYDRDLTDIFAIQEELSQQIAQALKAALSPEEKVKLARRPTDNTVAYDLFLQAREISNRFDNSTVHRRSREKLLEKAVELDPGFAKAWADLADSYAFAAFVYENGMEDYLAKAKHAIDEAVKFAPDDGEVLRSLGTYYYYAFRDYGRAREQYERLALQQPNDPTLFNSLALILRRQGDWTQSIAYARRACELDPANLKYLRNLCVSLQACNRYDEAIALQKRIVTSLPGDLMEGYGLAQLTFLARGSTREVDEFIAGLSPEDANSSTGLYIRRDWALNRGDYAEAIKLDRLQPYFEGSVYTREEQAMLNAMAHFAIGDQAGVVSRLGDAPEVWRRRLEIEPMNARIWLQLGLSEALLGHKVEAVRCVERAKELVPISRDALDGVSFGAYSVQAYDWIGDKERALAEYDRFLRTPNGLNVYLLEHAVSTLHDDPRFLALVKRGKTIGALP